jgi:hypothetical protein
METAVWTILILGVAAAVWVSRHSGQKRASSVSEHGHAIVDRDQAGIGPYAYLYVNADGSARELHPNERNYLETPFHTGDGSRPAVKRSYSQKDGWGEIKGYLKRADLPKGTPIHPAPSEDPWKPLTRADQIQFLRGKGMEVTENSDGTFTARKTRR